MSIVGSAPNEQAYLQKAPVLFAENVTKIENGKVIVVGLKSLLEQLKNARDFGFPWDLKVLELLEENEKKQGAIQFTWNSKKVGLHITTAILRFDDNNRIIEINEVYNKFEDITH